MCLLGTTLYSDCWQAYQRIAHFPNQNYNYRRVNHSLYIIDPGDRSQHTNIIESIWCQAKQHIKTMRGV